MSSILRWQLCNVQDQLVGDQYNSYEEARNAATQESEPHAVFELTYDHVDSAVAWTHEGCEDDPILYWPPLTACEHCTYQPAWLRGILLGANEPCSVEACDCRRYDSDLAAAFVVADRLVGDVVFWQHDAELHADVEHRVYEGELEFDYDPAEVGFELRRYRSRDEAKADDCLRYGEYPWVEVEGRALDWRHFRLINGAGFGGAA